jgi:cysteine synthase
MTNSVLPADLQLSITEPLTALPDDGYALSRYPQLAQFRAGLGNTPLVDVPGPEGGARIVAKYEFANPFGSVKDRAAYALLCSAITRHGEQNRPLKLLDFSGGNFALALAGLGTLTGIPIRLAVPDAMPLSIMNRLEGHGVQLDLVPGHDFLYGIIRRALSIAAKDPSWTMLHQMRNLANVAVHEFMTGTEIVRQLGAARPACLVLAVGTGGTLAGVGRALRRQFGEVALVGVTPQEMPYGTAAPPNGDRKFAGAGGLGYGLRQPFVDDLAPGALQRTMPFRRALEAMTEFRRATGTCIGASAAANWLVAREVAAGLSADQTVVTLFADAGLAEDWIRAGGQ